MVRLFFYLGVLLASLISLTTTAQTDDFTKDIEKLLSINGSAATYDMAFDQMVAQFKMMKPDAPDSIWKQVRTEVFNKEIAALNKQLIPIYKKHLAQSDVKGLIEFYQSPLGKKLTIATGAITKESMQLAQTWGMGLGQKMTGFLTEKGY